MHKKSAKFEPFPLLTSKRILFVLAHPDEKTPSREYSIKILYTRLDKAHGGDAMFF
jgi:ribosomal protein S24E